MVTPFAGDGALDLDAAAGLARWLVANGSEGLVVAGTTGEGSVLSDDEKLDLWRAVSEAVTVPVVANTGSNDTAHTVELTRQAAGCGAAAVLVVTPYYNRPSQAGVEAHLRAAAEATELPVVVYDIPVRTGRKISHAVLVRLASDVRNVLAVKDAAGDVGGTARLVAEAPDGFEVYSGNDDLTLPLVAVGAVGVIGVATHWAGPEMGEMVAAATGGDILRARRVNAGLLESYAFESTEATPNPLPAKAAMRALGQPVGQCRLPLGPAPEGLDEAARRIVGSIGPGRVALAS